MLEDILSNAVYDLLKRAARRIFGSKNAPAAECKKSAPVAELERTPVDAHQPGCGELSTVRFRELFQAHGVQLNQIPRVLPVEFRLTVAEVQNDNTLLSRSDWPNILTWAADFLGVRLAWLEGEDDRIYQPIHGYKEGIHVLRRVLDLLASHPRVGAYAFRSHELTDQGPENSDVSLLFMAEIGRINERPIFRYIPVTEWRWDYWRSREEFKLVVYALTQLGIPPGGWNLNPADLLSLASGYAFPEPLLHKTRRLFGVSYSWFPDAYVPPNATRDPQEAEQILRHFEQSRWRSLLALHAEQKNLWYKIGYPAEYWLRQAPPFSL
jgi:transcriptional regulator with XRE-family HTH domain